MKAMLQSSSRETAVHSSHIGLVGVRNPRPKDSSPALTDDSDESQVSNEQLHACMYSFMYGLAPGAYSYDV